MDSADLISHPLPPPWHIAHLPIYPIIVSKLILQCAVYAQIQESKVLGDCSGQRRRSYIADQAVPTARDPSADSTTTRTSGHHPSYYGGTACDDRHPSSHYPEAASRPGFMASRSTHSTLLHSSAADRRRCPTVSSGSARPVS